MTAGLALAGHSIVPLVTEIAASLRGPEGIIVALTEELFESRHHGLHTLSFHGLLFARQMLDKPI